ncbi:3113_t:CDS:2, partial [Gigaspora margarita]
NKETSDHLATCPANKETWKRLEEEIAGKQTMIWEKENGITTKTKKKKRERKILQKLRTTIRNGDSMNQPSSKEVELKTRKTE